MTPRARRVSPHGHPRAPQTAPWAPQVWRVPAPSFPCPTGMASPGWGPWSVPRSADTSRVGPPGCPPSQVAQVPADMVCQPGAAGLGSSGAQAGRGRRPRGGSRPRDMAAQKYWSSERHPGSASRQRGPGSTHCPKGSSRELTGLTAAIRARGEMLSPQRFRVKLGEEQPLGDSPPSSGNCSCNAALKIVGTGTVT